MFLMSTSTGHWLADGGISDQVFTSSRIFRRESHTNRKTGNAQPKMTLMMTLIMPKLCMKPANWAGNA